MVNATSGSPTKIVSVSVSTVDSSLASTFTSRAAMSACTLIPLPVTDASFIRAMLSICATFTAMAAPMVVSFDVLLPWLAFFFSVACPSARALASSLASDFTVTAPSASTVIGVPGAPARTARDSVCAMLMPMAAATVSWPLLVCWRLLGLVAVLPVPDVAERLLASVTWLSVWLWTLPPDVCA